MESLNKIAKSAGIVFFGLVFAKLIGYLFRIVVARADSELYGLYNLAYVIVAFAAALCLFGLEYGIKRYVAYYNGKKDFSNKNAVISTAIRTSLSLALFFSLVLFLFSDFIAGFFHAEKLGLALKLFAFLIPLTALSTILVAVLTAHKKVAPAIFSKWVVEPVLRLGVVLLAFFLGLRFYGVFFAFLISASVALLMLFYFSRNFFKFSFKGFNKEILLFSLPLTFVTMIYTIMLTLDTIMLGYFTDLKEVALYSAAFPTALLLFIIHAALLSIFLPVIIEKYAKKQGIRKEYLFVTKWIFIIALPFVLLMLFFGRPIITVLFGQEYASAGIALSILSGFYFFYMISAPGEQILLMLKKTKTLLLFYLVVFTVNIALNLVLIPLFSDLYGHGMYGAAIATGFSFFLLGILNVISSFKYLKKKTF